MSLIVLSPPRFRLDPELFSIHLIAIGEEHFGFDSRHEDGFAAAIVSRFGDALDASAILGPADSQVALYAPSADSLIVAVRERGFPAQVRWPLRQLATFSFDTKEVAHFGDESFAECCAAIEALLRHANELLPALAALREAESSSAA